MQAQSGNPDVYGRGAGGEAVETQRSGVSWAAVFAGAVAAAALSLVLFILGSGLGLAAISPWSYNSVAAIGVTTILWISFTQLAASAVGGYMAGRLRIRWTGLHADEVYFRDTAHGFLAWAVATLLTAMLVIGAMRAALSGAIDAGAGVAKVTAMAGADSSAINPADYFTDVLLRTDKPTDLSGVNVRGEVFRIFASAIQAGSLSADDRAYLARLVAARTGLSQADAGRRVDEVHARLGTAVATARAKAKEAADTARKASAGAALWMTVALLLGAFVASFTATIGGRLRDHVARPLSTRTTR